jgi:hypothetical protein
MVGKVGFSVNKAWLLSGSGVMEPGLGSVPGGGL